MMNNMGTIVAKIIQKCHTLDPHAHYSINIINGWKPNESKEPMLVRYRNYR